MRAVTSVSQRALSPSTSHCADIMQAVYKRPVLPVG